MKALQDFAALSDHRDADMMILAVLSHGRDGHIYARDGSVIDTEVIYSKFNNTNCPMLRGKPKFFIIQACRGDTTDVSMPEDEEFFDLDEKVPSR
jgi:hypothetical protein